MTPHNFNKVFLKCWFTLRINLFLLSRQFLEFQFQSYFESFRVSALKASGLHGYSIEKSFPQTSALLKVKSLILWHFTIEMHEIVVRFHWTDVPDPLSASLVGVHMAGLCWLLDHRVLWFQTLPDNHTVFSGDAVTQVSNVPCHGYAACAQVGTPWVKSSGR